LTSTFQDKSHEHEEIFKRIFESKVDKSWAMDKFAEVYKVQRDKDVDFDEYKGKVSQKFD